MRVHVGSKRRVKNVYELTSYEARDCFHCQQSFDLYEIDDGMGTVLCGDCTELSLEEVGFINDFQKGLPNA